MASTPVGAATGGLADMDERPTYIAIHRDLTSSHHFVGTPGSCAYRSTDVDAIVVCRHAINCACHSRSPSEKAAGITDLLAHDYVSPGVITLQYVPGSSDWLTSPSPTDERWYRGSGRP